MRSCNDLDAVGIRMAERKMSVSCVVAVLVIVAAVWKGVAVGVGFVQSVNPGGGWSARVEVGSTV